MRHHKYRAWDEKTERMFYSDRDYEECTFVCESEGYLKCYVPEEVPATLDEPSHIVGREIFEIMEFTGKLDKNKKEIYASDKVKIFDEKGFDTGIIGEIIELNYAWHIKDVGMLCLFDDNRLEVVGSIHDSAEDKQESKP